MYVSYPRKPRVISSRAGTTTSTSVGFFIPYFSQNSFCCCSVTKSCPTLCDPTDCSTPGSLSFSISQSLLKLMSINRWCHTSISSSVTPFSFCPQLFTASESFSMSRLFASGGQSIGASASVLPMNTQY